MYFTIVYNCVSLLINSIIIFYLLFIIIPKYLDLFFNHLCIYLLIYHKFIYLWYILLTVFVNFLYSYLHTLYIHISNYVCIYLSILTLCTINLFIVLKVHSFTLLSIHQFRLEKLCRGDGGKVTIRIRDVVSSFYLNSSLVPDRYLFYFCIKKTSNVKVVSRSGGMQIKVINKWKNIYIT